MQTVVSTVNAPPGEAFDYFVEMNRNAMTRHVIETFDRASFYGEMRVGRLADLMLGAYRTSLGHTQVGDNDLLQLVLVLPTSRSIVEFPDRNVALNRTSLCLLDLRMPALSRALEPVDRTMVVIPPAELNRRVRLEKSIFNQPVAANGDAALLTNLVDGLVRIGPSTLSPTAAALAREQLLDLIAVVFGGADAVPKLGAGARLTALKLRAAVDRQLIDQNADRASICSAAGVSERHANRILALEGTSVRRMLLERRLERCRAALQDRAKRGQSISEIALEAGFRDVFQFRRAFKDRFGRSPSECRYGLSGDSNVP